MSWIERTLLAAWNFRHLGRSNVPRLRFLRINSKALFRSSNNPNIWCNHLELQGDRKAW